MHIEHRMCSAHDRSVRRGKVAAWVALLYLSAINLHLRAEHMCRARVPKLRYFGLKIKLAGDVEQRLTSRSLQENLTDEQHIECHLISN